MVFLQPSIQTCVHAQKKMQRGKCKFVYMHRRKCRGEIGYVWLVLVIRTGYMGAYPPRRCGIYILYLIIAHYWKYYIVYANKVSATYP